MILTLGRALILAICLLGVIPLSLAAQNDPLVLLVQRLQTTAGSSARDCGRVAQQDNSKEADRCVRKAVSSGKAFYVRYDLPSTDSYAGAGLAGNRDGDVFVVVFDTTGFTPGVQKADEQLVDDGHSIVERCPKPIRFRVPFSPGKGLTCLRGSKNSLEIMSPR